MLSQLPHSYRSVSVVSPSITYRIVPSHSEHFLVSGICIMVWFTYKGINKKNKTAYTIFFPHLSMSEECCYCNKPVEELILAPGRRTLYCHPGCINDTCTSCGNTITINESYQFSGNDSFLCQTCGYDRNTCEECGELITDKSSQVEHDGNFYHTGCVPQ